MVLPLPMIKLGGLIVRTLTKPLAKVVKTRSKADPFLNSVCHQLGQQQHRVLVRFHMGYRGISNFTVKDLPADQAVEKGADLMGELIIFSVAVAVATVEYSRSTTKSREKEKAEAAKKIQQEEATERRFEDLEDKVIWLEAQLVSLGRIVEGDMDTRIETAAVDGGETTVLTPPKRRTGSDASSQSSSSTTGSSSSSESEEDGEAAERLSTSAAPSSTGLWNATYNAVTGLFR